MISFIPTQRNRAFLTLKEVTSLIFFICVVERKANLAELFAILARQSLGSHFQCMVLALHECRSVKNHSALCL
jgi:hypothetical protein